MATTYGNIYGQIMVQVSPGSFRNPTAAELKAYNANPTAFTVMGPGNKVLNTPKPATTTTTTAKPVAPAPVVAKPVAQPVAPKPVTTPVVTKPPATTIQQQYDQQMAALMARQKAEAEAAQAAANARAVAEAQAAQAAAKPVTPTPAPVVQPPVVQLPPSYTQPVAPPVVQTPTPTPTLPPGGSVTVPPGLAAVLGYKDWELAGMINNQSATPFTQALPGYRIVSDGMAMVPTQPGSMPQAGSMMGNGGGVNPGADTMEIKPGQFIPGVDPNAPFEDIPVVGGPYTGPSHEELFPYGGYYGGWNPTLGGSQGLWDQFHTMADNDLTLPRGQRYDFGGGYTNWLKTQQPTPTPTPAPVVQPPATTAPTTPATTAPTTAPAMDPAWESAFAKWKANNAAWQAKFLANQKTAQQAPIGINALAPTTFSLNQPVTTTPAK